MGTRKWREDLYYIYSTRTHWNAFLFPYQFSPMSDKVISWYQPSLLNNIIKTWFSNKRATTQRNPTHSDKVGAALCHRCLESKLQNQNCPEHCMNNWSWAWAVLCCSNKLDKYQGLLETTSLWTVQATEGMQNSRCLFQFTWKTHHHFFSPLCSFSPIPLSFSTI